MRAPIGQSIGRSAPGLRALSPLTQALAVAAAAHLAVTAMLAIFFHETLLIGALGDFFHLRVWRDDSWKPMHAAWAYLHTHARTDKSVYEAVFFEQKMKFQYPLTSVLIYEPIAAVVKNPELAGKILTGLSWLSLLATPLVLWRVLRDAAGVFAPDLLRPASSPARVAPAGPDATLRMRIDAALQGALVAALTISFYPLLNSYDLGQVQAWLNLAFALMVWLWIARRDGACGVLLAAACMVKPQLGVLLVWGALRGRWRFVATAAACIALGELTAIGLYGFANNFDYVRVLSFLSIHGEAYYPNQSFNGLLNRWFYPDLAGGFRIDSFPPENPVVRIGGALAAAAGLGAAVFARFGADKRGDALDLAAAGLFCTLASPIAWEHHYGVAAVSFALLLPAFLGERPRWRVYALGGAFLIFAAHLPTAQRLTLPPLNLIQSPLFFAALGLGALAATAPVWGRRERARAS